MTNIAVQAKRERDRLLRGQVAATNRITRDWVAARNRLQRQMAPVITAAASGNMTAAQANMAARSGQVQQIVQTYADRTVQPAVYASQRTAAESGTRAAVNLMSSQTPAAAVAAGYTFDIMNANAVEQMMMQLRTGPLQTTLSRYGKDTANKMSAILTDGMVTGTNPRQTANRLRAATAEPQWRALTMARTETLRAYREANIGTFERSNVTVKWIWTAALDAETCVACWAMHGTEHGKGATMEAHPNCRCVPVPETQTWTDLGFTDVPEVDTTVEPGTQVFDRQDDETKLAVLGPAKYEQYRNGTPITDMTRKVTSPTWGATIQVAPTL